MLILHSLNFTLAILLAIAVLYLHNDLLIPHSQKLTMALMLMLTIPVLSLHIDLLITHSLKLTLAIMLSIPVYYTSIYNLFLYSWKLTLAIMLAVPVLFIAGMIEMQILGGQIKGSQEALEAAGKVGGGKISHDTSI